MQSNRKTAVPAVLTAILCLVAAVASRGQEEVRGLGDSVQDTDVYAGIGMSNAQGSQVGAVAFVEVDSVRWYSGADWRLLGRCSWMPTVGFGVVSGDSIDCLVGTGVDKGAYRLWSGYALRSATAQFRFGSGEYAAEGLVGGVSYEWGGGALGLLYSEIGAPGSVVIEEAWAMMIRGNLAGGGRLRVRTEYWLERGVEGGRGDGLVIVTVGVRLGK